MDVMLLEGWKDIALHLERASGRKRSRFVLMRWARSKADPLPISRDPSNRPYADAKALTAWLGRHRFIY
jgi:hypothetical protein